MRKWYMTCGLLNGEFAAHADNLETARFKLGSAMHSAEMATFPVRIPETDLAAPTPGVPVRPCPPDLVEWIEATGAWTPHDVGRMYRVPGGWMICNFEVPGTEFIPVQGAAGLTVLEAGNE